MSTASMSYLNYYNGSWLSTATGPYVKGYGSNSYLFGVLHSITISVDSGYTINSLTFTIPKIHANGSSGSTNLKALLYNHDPRDEFSGAYPSSSTLAIGTASTGTLTDTFVQKTVTVSGLGIASSGTYYVFITTDDRNSVNPSLRMWADASDQLTCSVSQTRNPTPATSISISSTLVMGTTSTISWQPFTSGYTYKVYYKFTSSGTKTAINTSVSGSSVSWTPSTSLGSAIPNAISGTVTIYVQSWYGGSQIGSECQSEFSLSIPSSNRTPVCDSGWASASYTTPLSGHCIAGYSSIDVTIDSSKVSGAYGANISSIIASCNSQSRTTSGSLGNAIQGNNVVSVVATDSRGYTTTYSQTIVGEAYSPPSFTSLSIVRTNSSGVADSGGTYFTITPSVAFNSFSGDNTLVINYRWKSIVGTYNSWSPSSLANNTTSSALGNGGISTATSYLVDVRAYDTVIGVNNANVQTRTLINTVVAATLNLKSNGLGAAFFGLATADNTLQVYGNMSLTNPLPVTSGGTGGTTPAAARLNLGAVSAEATGSVTPPSQFTLSIEEGGTGATTVAAAQTNLGILDFDVRDQLVPTANISAGSGTQMSVQANYLYYSKSKDGRFFSLHGVLSVGGGSQSSGWSGFIITGLGLQPSAQKNVPSAGFLMQGSKILANYDYVNYNVLANGDVRLNYYQYGDGSSTSYHLNFYGNLVQIK